VGGCGVWFFFCVCVCDLFLFLHRYAGPGANPEKGVGAALRLLRSVALQIESGSDGPGWGGFPSLHGPGTTPTRVNPSEIHISD